MCSSKGFIKRMLPFFATFAVGIFIASFFVNISGPSFRRGGKRQEIKRLRVEVEDLRNENLRLKNEIESLRWTSPHSRHPGDGEVNELELLVPPPTIQVERRAKR